MKIKFTRKGLSNLIKRVGAIVPGGGILETFTHFLVEVKGGAINFTANDLALQVTGATAVETDGDGRFTVPAKKFSALVESFPADAEITLESKNNRHTLRCGKGRYVLDGLDAADFPITSIKATGSVNIESGLLLKMLDFVVPSMAVRDIRYYLNAAMVEMGDGRVTVVSTDGHRMGVTQRDMTGQGTASLLLPSESVRLLSGILAEFTGEVAIDIAPNAAAFHIGNFGVVTKLVDGRFPDYQRVLPAAPSYASIPIQPALDALKRATILCNEKTRGVKVFMEPGVFRIATPDMDAASEEVDSVGDVTHEFGVNLHYLVDALSVLGGDRAEIGPGLLSDPATSMVVRAEGDNSSRIVVMPMRL